MSPKAFYIHRPFENVKNYFLVYEDRVSVRTIIMFDENEDSGEDNIIYRKFGKKLGIRYALYSFETIRVMNEIATNKKTGSFKILKRKK